MQAEDWKVLHDKVLVRRDDMVTEQGGLTVPEKARRQQAQGTVLRTGPGTRGSNGTWRPLTVKVGDQVRFSAYSGVPMVDDDESVIVLREDELLGYYREE